MSNRPSNWRPTPQATATQIFHAARISITDRATAPSDLLFLAKIIAHNSRYHGMYVPVIGVDAEGLLMVPLPPGGSVLAYLGYFRPEYVQRLSAIETFQNSEHLSNDECANF
jgi:hypothetical protein